MIYDPHELCQVCLSSEIRQRVLLCCFVRNKSVNTPDALLQKHIINDEFGLTKHMISTLQVQYSDTLIHVTLYRNYSLLIICLFLVSIILTLCPRLLIHLELTILQCCFSLVMCIEQ